MKDICEQNNVLREETRSPRAEALIKPQRSNSAKTYSVYSTTAEEEKKIVTFFFPFLFLRHQQKRNAFRVRSTLCTLVIRVTPTLCAAAPKHHHNPGTYICIFSSKTSH